MLCYTCSLFWNWLEGAFHKTIVFVMCLEHWDAMILPWALRIVNISLDVWQKAAREHAYDNWTLDANRTQNPKTFLQNRPGRQKNLAPLICRVVRAVRVRGRWAWIPGGGTPLRSIFTPNLRSFKRDFARTHKRTQRMHFWICCDLL